MALQALGEGIWIAESATKDFGGMSFPIRMTIIRLDTNNLMVISPVHPTQELVKEIEALGLVKYIVAPNCMHYMHINTFSAAFPGAEIWGPKDLQDKRRDIAFTDVLDANHIAPWSSSVEMTTVHAKPPMFEEVIFFHKASKTVIVTDLLFNFQKFNNWLEKLVAKLNGGYKKLVITRLGRRYFNDKESMHKSAAKMLAWNPDNLIMAHGDVIVGDANLALREPLSAYAGANS